MKSFKPYFVTALLLVAMAFGTKAWAQNGTFTVSASTINTGCRFTITRTSNTDATETVNYRTVNLSAVAGQHYTSKIGQLTFDADNNTRTVDVGEAGIAISDAAYQFQNGTQRTYRLEVLDQGGFELAHKDRSITIGIQFGNTYVNQSVTDLVYFNNGSIRSGSGNKYLDVAYNPSSNSNHVMSGSYIKILDSYDYDNHTLCNISTGSLYSNSTTLRNWLNTLNYKMYATVYFTMKEEDDGYQYIQILADNSTTKDGKDPDGNVNDPVRSIYKAAFILTKTENHCTTDHYQVFPHRYNCHNRTDCGQSSTHTEFEYDDSYLYAQKYRNTTFDAPNNGALVLNPTVNTVNVRFDANGSGDDTWYLKNLKVRLALVDATAPTLLNNSTDAIVANGGKRCNGNDFYISVPFNEIVLVTGTPTLNTDWGTASYIYGSGSNVLTFKGTINTTVGKQLKITGKSGTIQDMAGNTFSGSISKDFSGVVVEASYPYPISYTLNNGTLPSGYPTTYTYDAATTLMNPTRTGYDFDGWTGSNGDTPETSVTIAAHSHGNVSYTANWSIITYNLSYDLAGGSVATNNPATYTVVTPDFTLVNPTRLGYDFVGWTGADLTEPTLSVTIAQGFIGDRTYTANWTPHIYSITYNLNGGSATNPETYTIETPDFTLVNPTKAGYTFAGWTGSNGNTPQTSVTIAQGSTGDRTYSASWSVNHYTVQFNANATNGIAAAGTMANQSFVYDEAQTLTANAFSRTGYTFAGWNTAADGSGTAYTNGQSVINLTAEPNATVTLYAQWDVIPWEGAGTSAVDPYLIIYPSQLLKLADDVNGGTNTSNKYFKLGNDIDMNGVTFNGIGNLERSFKGHFNGNNKTISNLTINSSNDCKGLFGHLYGNVHDLILDGANILGRYQVAGIAGYARGTISNCLVTNSIITYTYGDDGGIIAGCINNATLTQNYYRNCTLTKGSNTYTTNIGVGDDVGDMAGARSLHTLTLPTHVTAASDETLMIDQVTYYASNVTVTLTPETGALTDVTVNGVPATDNGNGTWSFTMPAADATVSCGNSVTYIDANGTLQTCTSFTLIENSNSSVTYGTENQECWFVVSGNVTINGTLTLQGSSQNLILCDGASLNISRENANTIQSNVSNSSTFSIYGQTNGTGSINATNANYVPCIQVSGILVINGGSVSATSSGYNGIRAVSGFTINGGSVSATGGSGKDGISSGGDITLGWRNLSDRIYASRYDLPYTNSLVVKSGQRLSDGTTVFSGNQGNGYPLNGKTLQPCFSLTLPEHISDTAGAISQGDARYALYGSTVILKPNLGYSWNNVTVNGVAATNNVSDIWSFTMPGADATVSATVWPIVWHLNYFLDGTCVAPSNPDTYTIESPTFTLNNPTRDYYTFAGWTGTDLTEPTLNVTIAQGSIGDRFYYDNWTAVSYTITYDLGGGSVATANPTSFTVETPDFTLNNPTREGYTFAGWTGTDLNNPTLNVTIAQGSHDNLSYTATWTPITYNLSYDLAGGSLATANPATYTIETPDFTLNNPTKIDYDFAGWTGTDLNEPTLNVTIAQGTMGDRSYTATWQAHAYSITYDLDGGSVATPNPTSYTIETPDFTLNNPTKAGSNFAGWTGSDLGEPTLNVTIRKGYTGDRSYTATWMEHVQYVDADGNIQYCPDYTLIESCDVNSTYGVGAQQDRWYVVGGTVTTKDITFACDAHLILMDGASLTIDGSVSAVGELTLYGQTQGTGALNGWFIQSQYDLTINGGSLTLAHYSAAIDCWASLMINRGTITATSTHDHAISASYNIYINGGTVTATNQSNLHGSILSINSIYFNGGVVNATAPAGYYGLCAGYNYGSQYGFNDIILSWTTPADRLTASSYGGNVNVVMPSNASVITAFEDPSGNLYYGDLTEAQKTAAAGQTLSPFTDYDREFNITYVTNGGTLPAVYPQTFSYNTTVQLPVPTRENYHFIGWHDDAECLGYPITEITAGTTLGDITLYAEWGEAYTQVSYVDENGQAQTVQANILYNDSPNNPGGIYTVRGYGLDYNENITFSGNTTLIILDGSYFTIWGTFHVDGDFTVYGQEEGYGGWVSTQGITATGDIAFYGGDVAVSNSSVSAKNGNGTITLGWTGMGNKIQVHDYQGTVVVAKTLMYEESNTITVVNTGTVAYNATIEDKELVPHPETLNVNYIDENNVMHSVNATVLWGNEANTLPGGYYTFAYDSFFGRGYSFSGNTTFIIRDGYTVHLGSNSLEGNGIAVTGDFAVYGQLGRGGYFSVLTNGSDALHASDKVTIGDLYSCYFNGTNGIWSGSDILIAGSYFYSNGAFNANSGNGTITLGYMCHSDEVHSTSYQGTVIIREGQKLMDDQLNYYTGTLTADEVAYIGNKTLCPSIDNVPQLEVEGYGDGDGKWVFIASPLMGSVRPAHVNGLVGNQLPNGLYDYDLYRLNTGTMVWENYHQHDSYSHPFTIDNGKGYLYASKEDNDVIFYGAYNTNTVQEVALEVGYNLVGNPFPTAAYVDKPFYKMNAAGTGVEPVANYNSYTPTTIPACTGVIVQATSTGEHVTFSQTAPSNATDHNGSLSIVLSRCSERGDASTTAAALDKAIVSFDNDNELGKYYFLEQDANIYIPKGSEEFAIAYSDGVGEMPLNFKAHKDGEYTLTFSGTFNFQFSTLNLIDNLTGANIDLLQTSSYTFTAKTSDYASRFKLVFANDNQNDNENEDFAFISNGEIIVNGTGTIQVIDMLGRTIVTREASSDLRLPTSDFSTGVYVLRLIDGKRVKTQKIVIR